MSFKIRAVHVTTGLVLEALIHDKTMAVDTAEALNNSNNFMTVSLYEEKEIKIKIGESDVGA